MVPCVNFDCRMRTLRWRAKHAHFRFQIPFGVVRLPDVCPHQFLASAERLAAFRNIYTGDDVAYAKVVDLATLDAEFPTGDTIPGAAKYGMR